MFEEDFSIKRLNFFNLEQKLRIFTVWLMLVSITKLDLFKIFHVEFVNVIVKASLKSAVKQF